MPVPDKVTAHRHGRPAGRVRPDAVGATITRDAGLAARLMNLLVLAGDCYSPSPDAGAAQAYTWVIGKLWKLPDWMKPRKSIHPPESGARSV
jgi:hypothetical protein